MYSRRLHYIVLATGFAAMRLGQSVTQCTNAERKPQGTHQSAQPSPWMEHQTHSETQMNTQPLTEVEKEIQCKYLKTMGWANPILKGQIQAGFSILQADNPSMNLALMDWICPSCYACKILYFVFCFCCTFPLYSLSTCYRCYHVTTCHVNHATLWNDSNFLRHSIRCMHISNGAQSVKKVSGYLRKWKWGSGSGPKIFWVHTIRQLLVCRIIMQLKEKDRAVFPSHFLSLICWCQNSKINTHLPCKGQ